LDSQAVKTHLKQLVHSLYELYSINSIVFIAAVVLAVMPIRPQFLVAFDDALYELIANPQQAQLQENEHSIAKSQAYEKMGLNDVAGSLASIFNGDAFRSSNTREEITPAAFYPVERLGIVLIALFLIRGLRNTTELESLKTISAIAVAMVLVELYSLAFANLWLPVGVAVQFLFAAYFVMLLQLKYELKAATIQKRLQDISFEYIQRLHGETEAQSVIKTLPLCRPTQEAFEFAYLFAQTQEKKRQYETALDAYRFIHTQDRHYKDVASRISDLHAAIERKKSLVDTAPVPLEATMIVESGVRTPTLGRYEIIRELGRGAMGIVYLGQDPKITRKVAIKTLPYRQFDNHQVPELRDRFFREAKAAGRLAHPNIVTVYDVGEETDLAYIAMDYIEGTALDAHSSPGRLLPVETVYEIILKVAEALSYAHKNKIVHRDIKPSNLIFNPDGHKVKVSDFGIARMSDDSKTKTGHVMGSPVYMAPEQLKGSNVTGAADIFSLGATFYQLLTGKTPFSADSLPELTIKIMSKKHKSVRELRSDLPASAVRITNKALSKDPSKRFADADEMASHLRRALANDFKARAA